MVPIPNDMHENGTFKKVKIHLHYYNVSGIVFIPGNDNVNFLFFEKFRFESRKIRVEFV